ncbi:MAG TPA: TonB family protein [Burkholderiales bacterium]|nr:TonB family protein [Burkholderiales bacterium]
MIPDTLRAALGRLSAALLASALLHALLISSVTLKPPRHPAAAPATLIAYLEPAAVGALPDHAVDALPPVDAKPAALPAATARRASPEHAPAPARAVESTAVDAPALALTPAVDPTYYPAARLDRYPRELTGAKPDFPARAEADGVPGGEVTLLLSIEETGAVSDATVVDAHPAGYFDDSARAWALERTRFAPAQRNGREVKSRVLIKLSYGSERSTAGAPTDPPSR